ncbi:condensation domain-containing protein [Actinokineospora sp. NBRC 105648]|uniref:condensation domain-containing protein n=1 Tax=Actinokineospora sp. NBRC 105648 TaxID=3032206 RepID=UPI0024A14C5F|nr:condensation domain-containing protein [Actinokineospora sp. NBRC 105648]GLZ41923.1 hypothetical protein Acsp05_55470 [Actinokineospora sp. NBRC 105648]
MTATTDVTALLGRVWAELLGVDSVAPDDDFFALGGHSVTATRLTARVRKRLGVDLPVRAVFEDPTLAGLAARVASAPVVPPTVDRPARVMSDVQRLQWFAEMFSDGHSPYTIPLTVRIRGRLDTPALRRALRDVVARHEVLRTRYPDRDGQPVPEVDPADRFAVGMLRVTEDDLDGWLRAQARLPFRLGTELPVRATLCRLSATDHVLSLVLHHIAGDGWSRALLLDDLASLYAFHRGLGPAPATPRQYTDVVEPEATDSDVRWWVDHLRGAPSRTTFAGSWPRPAALTDAGDSVPLPIGPESTERVRAVATACGTTTYAVCMAALVALLSWDSGETDVVVATSVAGRAEPDAESVVGCFINTVAVRTRVGVESTARDLFGAVMRSTVDALDHPGVSFDRIVRDLGGARDPAYRPLCQVMLTMHNEPAPRPQLVDLDAQWVEVDNGGAKCDVFVDLTDDGGPLRGLLTYRTQLYDRAFAADLAARLCTLLDLMAADPDRPVAALRSLLEETHVQA